jgi:phospholipase/carboxylesterase
MWIFKQTLPAGVAAITLRAPLELAGGGFVWFKGTNLRPGPDALDSALNKLEHFLTALPRVYPVDPTRMILMGFSQGAFMGNAFVLTHPYDAIGVVSLAGAMPQLPEIEYHANLLAGMPVFIAHGIRDEAIPVSAARQTRDTYSELGADVTYGEYPVAHKMNPQAMTDLKVWLARLFPE